MPRCHVETGREEGGCKGGGAGGKQQGGCKGGGAGGKQRIVVVVDMATAMATATRTTTRLLLPGEDGDGS